MKYIFSLLLTVLSTSLAWGDSQGEEALRELSQRLKTMGHYEADIMVDVDGSTMSGHYRVSGDRYHVNMGSVEFWGEGESRYEVSHKIEEVVISKPIVEDNTLLNNPSQAFDLVGQGFDVVLRGRTIVLTPNSSAESGVDVDHIEIDLNDNNLPTKITYEADGNRAVVELSNMKQSKSELKGVDISKYKKYDVVDLR